MTRESPSGTTSGPLLLLLAIAADALGLMILAVFYSSGTLLRPGTRGIDDGGHGARPLAQAPPHRQLLAVRDWRRSLSWTALYFGGFHPALALVPVRNFNDDGPICLLVAPLFAGCRFGRRVGYADGDPKGPEVTCG
jgi:hypothetical protein